MAESPKKLLVLPPDWIGAIDALRRDGESFSGFARSALLREIRRRDKGRAAHLSRPNTPGAPKRSA